MQETRTTSYVLQDLTKKHLLAGCTEIMKPGVSIVVHAPSAPCLLSADCGLNATYSDVFFICRCKLTTDQPTNPAEKTTLHK